MNNLTNKIGILLIVFALFFLLFGASSFFWPNVYGKVINKENHTYKLNPNNPSAVPKTKHSMPSKVFSTNIYIEYSYTIGNIEKKNHRTSILSNTLKPNEYNLLVKNRNKILVYYLPVYSNYSILNPAIPFLWVIMFFLTGLISMKQTTIKKWLINAAYSIK